MDRNDALALIEAIRSGQFEDTFTEVKAAHKQLPKRIYETLSAFANQMEGGVLILGLD